MAVDLVETLRTLMREEFGINSDEELIKAVDDLEEIDLGIFVTPYDADSRMVS